MIPSKPNTCLLSNGGDEAPGSPTTILQLGIMERITILLAVCIASGVFAAPVEHVHCKSYVSKKNLSSSMTRFSIQLLSKKMCCGFGPLQNMFFMKF
jgi:hypothetical protein